MIQYLRDNIKDEGYVKCRRVKRSLALKYERRIDDETEESINHGWGCLFGADGSPVAL